MDDLNKEVAMMFVRHCNEPSLSVVFKSKLADSWTAKEVQERIDEFHIKSRASRPTPERFTRQAVAVVSDDTQQVGNTEAEVKLHSHKQGVGQPQQSAELASMQSSMNKMAEILNEVMCRLASPKKPSASRNSTFQWWGVPGSKGCSICSDGSHSTRAHCSLHGLCSFCHQPGHMKFQCPKLASPAPQSSPNPPAHQGN